jgi:hypothetical protein
MLNGDIQSSTCVDIFQTLEIVSLLQIYERTNVLKLKRVLLKNTLEKLCKFIQAINKSIVLYNSKWILPCQFLNSIYGLPQ